VHKPGGEPETHTAACLCNGLHIPPTDLHTIVISTEKRRFSSPHEKIHKPKLNKKKEQEQEEWSANSSNPTHPCSPSSRSY
jgi:hypothetical protein